MTEFTTSGAYADLRSWSISAAMVAPGGGTTLFTLSPPHLRSFWPRIDNIRPIVDGMGIRVTIAAGGVVNSEITAFGGAAQHLTSFTAGAAASTSYAHHDLKIPLNPSQADTVSYLTIRAAFAAADACFLSAYGHFDVPALISEPTPVSVEEFHLFRPRKVSGPV